MGSSKVQKKKKPATFADGWIGWGRVFILCDRQSWRFLRNTPLSAAPLYIAPKPIVSFSPVKKRTSVERLILSHLGETCRRPMRLLRLLLSALSLVPFQNPFLIYSEISPVKSNIYNTSGYDPLCGLHLRLVRIQFLSSQFPSEGWIHYCFLGLSSLSSKLKHKAFRVRFSCRRRYFGLYFPPSRPWLGLFDISGS